MAIPALIGLGAQAGLGVLGEILAGMDEAEAERLIAQATDQYGEIDIPTLEALVAEQLGPSAMTGVQTDPAFAAAQREALNELMSLARSGGLRLEDKAALNEALGQAARTESAGRRRIAEELAARGVGGSGAELLMQLQGNQQTAQRAADTGLRVAGDAQRRALDAMLAGGRLAGDIRGQEFGEKSRVAQAQDEIARFNAAGRERAALANRQMQQQSFANRLALADRRAAGFRDRASMKRDAARGKRMMFGGFGAAASRGGSLVNSTFSDDEEGF